MSNKLAIIIVVWNVHDLISTQLDLLKRFCKDDSFDIIVIDNSTNLSIAARVKKYVETAGCIYIKTNTNLETSNSHAFACNHAYETYKLQYEYMLFLDHDNFPIKDFSVKNLLNDKVIGGVGQTRLKTYLWAGCVALNNKIVDQNMVDFSTNPQFNLDTGGNLYQILEKYGLDSCVFLDQFETKNTLYDKYDWWAYNIIANQKKDAQFSFMHFINASNWSNSQTNEERINSLMILLKNYVDSETNK